MWGSRDSSDFWSPGSHSLLYSLHWCLAEVKILVTIYLFLPLATPRLLLGCPLGLLRLFFCSNPISYYVWIFIHIFNLFCSPVLPWVKFICLVLSILIEVVARWASSSSWFKEQFIICSCLGNECLCMICWETGINIPPGWLIVVLKIAVGEIIPYSFIRESSHSLFPSDWL